MLPHQQRVVDEKDELGIKFSALVHFIASNPVFDGLDHAEQGRLRDQRDAMRSYYDILCARIAAFK